MAAPAVAASASALAAFKGGEEGQRQLHAIVDEICGRTRADMPAGVPGLDAATADALRQVVIQAVGQGLKKEALAEQLAHAKLEAAAARVVAEVVHARRAEMERALRERVVEVAPSHLRDFDWSVRLVLASDRISSMREPRLLLNLQLAHADPSAPPRHVAVELARDDLDRLLASLERAASQVQELQIP
jgi:hypothetical protein